MSRSLARGDYRLILAVESSSRPGDWYRQLWNIHNGQFACDCPRWIRTAERLCKHNEWTMEITGRRPAMPPLLLRTTQVQSPTAHVQSLIAAARGQYEGLAGTWTMQERETFIRDDPYRVVLLRLETPEGLVAAGTVAFAHRHGIDTQRMIPGVAGWAAYAIAAQIAQQSGFDMMGQPPDHFKMRGAGRSVAGGLGLGDTMQMQVGERADLGDGLTPNQRAENMLRLFLGNAYFDLVRDGYLDVPSQLYASARRVYRLRLDPNWLSRSPAQQRTPRVRVFENGRYVKDLCIVRTRSDVPVGDWFLTVFFGLLSDERTALSVVNAQYNVFPPYSDGPSPEGRPPVWFPRPAANAA